MTSTAIDGAFAPSSIAHPGAGPGLVQRIVRAVARARRRNATRRALNELSDHMLKDIGVRRSEIDSIADTVASGQWDPTRIPRNFPAYWI